MSFDWQTDEEDDAIWDNDAPIAHPIREQINDEQVVAKWHPFTHGRRWLWLLAPLTVGLIFWQVTAWGGEQIETRENEIEQDIAAMFSQLYLAAVTQDAEIVQPIMHRRDYDWASQQTRMISSGDFIHRHQFGLTADTTNTPQLEIDLAPDQQTAILRWEQPYTSLDGQTITLTQTHYTTRANGRWQLGPLPGNHWGNFATEYIDQGLELSFYETDRAISENLLTGINEANVCTRTYALDWCAGDGKFGHKQLHLSNSLTALYDIWENELIYHGRRPAIPISLPSPTLVGLPADERSTQYMIDGYIAQHRIASEALRVNCCTLFAHAMFNYHLAQEGLRPWPYDQADYAAYFQAPFPINRWIFWAFPDESTKERNIWQTHLLASYIYDQDPENWRAITDDLSNRAIQWGDLSEDVQTISLSSTSADFRPWLDYVADKANIPLGLQTNQTEDIQLLCRPDLFKDERYQRIQYSENGLTEVLSEPEIDSGTTINPFPTGDGYIEHERYERLTVYAQDKEPVPIYLDWTFSDTDFAHKLLLSPEKRYIVMTALPDQLGEEFRYYQVDRERCRTQNINFCAYHMLDGIPTWNPSETHALQSHQASPVPLSLASVGSRPKPTALTLADAGGRPLIRLGAGLAPFWLDDQTFGFAQQTQGPLVTSTNIFTGTVNGSKLTPWLTGAEITPLLPDGYVTTPYFVQLITSLPADPNIIMFAFNTSQAEGLAELDYLGNTHLLFYDRVSEIWLPTLPLNGRAQEYEWSPDGRWLHIQATFGQSYLIDLETREVRSEAISLPDVTQWSPDGTQLLQTHIGFLTVTEPDSQAFSVLPYPENNVRCTSGGYLDSEFSVSSE